MSNEDFGESLKSIAKRLSRVLTSEKRRSEFYGHIDGRVTTICEGTFPNDQLLSIIRIAIPFAVQGRAFDEGPQTTGHMPIVIDYVHHGKEDDLAFFDLIDVNLVTFKRCNILGYRYPDNDEPSEFYMSTWIAAGKSLKLQLRSAQVADITARLLGATEKAGFIDRKIGHTLHLVNPRKIAAMCKGRRLLNQEETGIEYGIDIAFTDGTSAFVEMPEEESRSLFNEIVRCQHGF